MTKNEKKKCYVISALISFNLLQIYFWIYKNIYDGLNVFLQIELLGFFMGCNLLFDIFPFKHRQNIGRKLSNCYCEVYNIIWYNTLNSVRIASFITTDPIGMNY